MNHSNDPILIKNLAAIKQAKFFHHRKFSQQTDLARKTLENIDSFAKEAVPIVNKTKQVGKIRRNSIASTNQQNSKGKQINENVASGCAIDKWVNDELLSKIRCSQIVNRPQKSITSALKQLNTPNQAQKTAINRNTKSVSSHYQAHYTNLIKQYQKKKQKINHEIESLRKTQTIKVQNMHQINIGNSLNNETPKFGNYFSQSQKIISMKPPLKTTRDPKIVQFLNAIKCQIDLQAKLRNLKHQIPKEEQQTIAQVLKTQHGIDQGLTKLDSDQFDPFSQRKPLNTETLVSQLANAHLAAEQNWNKNIKNSFEQATLQEIFTSLSNRNQNSTISLIAFVREIGILLQNQKYLRNRDLYRIHKRIAPFRKEVFINMLGNTRNK